MAWKRTRNRWLAVAMVLVLSGGFAGLASGDTVSGKAMVVAKDASSVTLDNGVVLLVTPTTRISNEHGVPITVGDLVVSPKLPDGGVELIDKAMVAYEASGRDGTLSAYSIRVLGQIAR